MGHEVLAGKTSSLTKLEVGVVGADMVAGTEQALHHQSSSHGIKQAEVLWDATFLEETQSNIELLTELMAYSPRPDVLASSPKPLNGRSIQTPQFYY